MSNDKMTKIHEMPNGTWLYRKANECGGYAYYSDSIGGGVMLFDTCLHSFEELEFCIQYDRDHRKDDKI